MIKFTLEHLNKMNRKALKKLIKAQELEITVMNNDSDDDIRIKIMKATDSPLEDSPTVEKGSQSDGTEENEDASDVESVTFISSFPRQHIAHIQFEGGVFTTSDEKEIEMIRKNRKFGTSITEKR